MEPVDCVVFKNVHNIAVASTSGRVAHAAVLVNSR